MTNLQLLPGKLVSSLAFPWALVQVQGNGQPGRRPPTSVAWLEYQNKDDTYDAWIVWFDARKAIWRPRYKKQHKLVDSDILHRFGLGKEYILSPRSVRAAKAALPVIEEPPTTSCDVCNKQNVEVSRGSAAGIETFACEECSK